jgi:hypothetical protein
MQNPEDFLNDFISNINNQNSSSSVQLNFSKLKDSPVELQKTCTSICNGLLDKEEISEQEIKLLEVLLTYLSGNK